MALKPILKILVPKPAIRRLRGLGSRNFPWRRVSAPNAPVMEKPLIAYLARRTEGLAVFTRFVQSYKTFSDETPHDLLIIFKGFLSNRSKRDYYEALEGVRFLEMEKADVGFDIGSFRKVVERFAYSHYLFLGSFCQIKARNYLTNLLQGLRAASRAGIVGPSGSWESFVGGRFPNYHIRTSAFMVSRDVLLRIYWPRVITKYDAYEFEHGVTSITRQIMAMGLEPYVVSADGRWFGKERWRESLTYRADDQDALMIGDKQTDIFKAADAQERARLGSLAWGSAFERWRLGDNLSDAQLACEP